MCSEKLNFDLLTPPIGSGGVCWQNICHHIAAFVIPFNFFMQHDHFLRKLNLDLLTSKVVGGGGVCGQNIYYHGAALLILFDLIAA